MATRYYFDLKFDGEESSRDEEGVELQDSEEARIEAARTLSDFCSEIIRSNKGLNTLTVVIRDEVGPVLSAEVYFKNLRPN